MPHAKSKTNSRKPQGPRRPPFTGGLDGFIFSDGLRALVPYSRVQIHRLVRSGQFPPPYKIGESERTLAWKASDIKAWIDSRPLAKVLTEEEASRGAE